MNDVLIDTLPDDPHAHALKWALNRKGVNCNLIFGSDFPENVMLSQSISNTKKQTSAYKSANNSFNLIEERKYTYWRRRCISPVTPERVHEDDAQPSERENYSALWNMRAIFDFLPNVICLNPISGRRASDNKFIQLLVAKRVGFSIPNSLFSNCPEDINSFFENSKKHISYKTHRPVAWNLESKDKKSIVAHQSYCSIIEDISVFSKCVLQDTSGIYQEYEQKDFEVRVFYFGQTSFGTRINSQNNLDTKVDWRKDQEDMDATTIDVPEEMARKCNDYLKAMDLTMGCFDFIVRDGDWIFLECNEQGQWLWQEQLHPEYLMLDAFAEFMKDPSDDFKYVRGDDSVTFQEYLEMNWEYDLEKTLSECVVPIESHIVKEKDVTNVA